MKVWAAAGGRGGGRGLACSHVVGDVDGIELVGEEPISQVHTLLLPARINRNHLGVDYDDNPHNEVVLLEHRGGDERDEVEGVLFGSVEFDDHDEQMGPREHGARGRGMESRDGRGGKGWGEWEREGT